MGMSSRIGPTRSYSAAAGNRTATTPSSGPSISYSWDQANDLSEVAGASSTTYTYDGNGLRQSATSGATTTNFTWDVEGSPPTLLSDGANSYIYGPGGTPVEQVSSSGTPTYLLTDQLGSTRALTNSSGTVIATFTYDAWGNLSGSTGSATTPFMYAGEYLDPTGLYYLRNRYYDPATGQFLSVDPLVAETGSRYGYTSGNPINNTDPTGLFCVGPLCFGFHPMAGADAIVNIGRGASFGLSDTIANWISPGASCTVPQNSFDQFLGSAATSVVGTAGLTGVARLAALQLPYASVDSLGGIGLDRCARKHFSRQQSPRRRAPSDTAARSGAQHLPQGWSERPLARELTQR